MATKMEAIKKSQLFRKITKMKHATSLIIGGIAIATVIGAIYYKKEEQQSGGSSGSGGESYAQLSSTTVPILSSGDGYHYDIVERFTISEFLDEVRSLIKGGASPAEAWKRARKNMYVVDNGVEKLESTMLSQSSLACGLGSEIGDGGCGGLTAILNRNVPKILDLRPCLS